MEPDGEAFVSTTGNQINKKLVSEQAENPSTRTLNHTSLDMGRDSGVPTPELKNEAGLDANSGKPDIEAERQAAVENALKQGSVASPDSGAEVDKLLQSLGVPPDQLGLGELDSLLEKPPLGTLIKSIFGGIANLFKNLFRKKPKEQSV